MDFQSNFDFQNQVNETAGYKLSLLDAFASIKDLFLAKATDQERKNELDDYEFLQFGVRKDKV